MESEAEALPETLEVASEADASSAYVVLVLLATLVLGEVFRRWTKSSPAADSKPTAPAAKSKPKSAAKSKSGSAAPVAKSTPELAAETKSGSAAPAAKSTPEPVAKSKAKSAAPAAESKPESDAKRDSEVAAAAGSITAAAQAPQVAPPISPQDLMDRLDSVPVFTMVVQDRTAGRLVESGGATARQPGLLGRV